MFTMMLSDHEWTVLAEHCGITPDERELYKQAFAEIEEIGLDAFAHQLLADLTAARNVVRATGMAPPNVQHLEIRKTVLVEVHDFIKREALLHHNGTMH